LATSKAQFAVDLVGPTRPDLKWQARAGEGFYQRNFQVDWDKQHAVCPEGKTSIGWTPATEKRGNELVVIKFSVKDCRPCASFSKCIHSGGRHLRRTLKLRRQDYHQCFMVTRDRQKPPAFWDEYTVGSAAVVAFPMDRAAAIPSAIRAKPVLLNMLSK
jgi:transposase